MGDIDECHSFFAQVSYNGKEPDNLPLRERGSRLVEDYNPRVIGHRLGNLYHLPLRDRHAAHDGPRVYVHFQGSEQSEGVVEHAFLVNYPETGRVPAEKQIVHDSAIKALIELLMDHGDTVF